MKAFAFDNREYGKRYALPLTCLQIPLAVGFLFEMVVFVMPANTFTIPDAVLPLAYIAIPVSLVGFPLVTVIKHGYRRSLSWSKLTIDNGIITYDRLAEKEWTAVGSVEEHHIFSISQIESAEFSLRYLLIRGRVHKKVINNNRLLEEKDISSIKIPRAYANMEKIVIK